MIYSHVDNKGIPLQNKLYNIINKKNGFFIELGANDGLFQSNTAFFEKEHEWTGILIEPSLKGFELCKKNRINSICLNYACVSDNFKDEYVFGDFLENHPMGSIEGKRLQNKTQIKVKAITLEKILNKYNCKNIDFLSLDTEGYELEILKGLNLNKHRPKYMLIEIYPNQYNDIMNYLTSNNYKLHSNFSNYNIVDNPGWDGSHNDYLFIDNTGEL
jgi:FkbM family methyltransferase